MKNFIINKLQQPANKAKTFNKWLWFAGLYIASLVVIGFFMWFSHYLVSLAQQL